MKHQFRLRLLILLLTAALVLPIAAKRSEQQHADTFQLVEASIADIQDAFDSQVLTPSQLVSMYLARIEAYDKAGPQLNSYMFVNRRALHQLQ